MNNLIEFPRIIPIIQLHDRIISLIAILKKEKGVFCEAKTILSLLKHCDFISISMKHLEEHLMVEGRELNDKIFVKDIEDIYPKALISIKNLKDSTTDIYQGDTQGRDVNDVLEDIVTYLEEIINYCLKMLFALDKAVVRRIESALDVMLNSLNILMQSSLNDLIENFKILVDNAVTVFELVKARSSLMENKFKKETLGILSLQLYNTLPFLSTEVISSFHNHSFRGSRINSSFVADKVRELIASIRKEANTATSHYELQEPSVYIKTLDEIFKLVTLKATDKGIEKLPLLESLKPHVEVVLQYSICIAQCSSGSDHARIMTACENVLHQMKILSEVEKSVEPDPGDVDVLLDVIVDVMEILEVKVNIALIKLIVEVFTEPFKTLDYILDFLKLEKIAREDSESCNFLNLKSFISKFEEEIDKICFVGGFIVACISNSSRVNEIECDLALLSWLESGLVAAFLRSPGQLYSSTQSLASHWRKVVKNLRNSIYQILEVDALVKVTKIEVHIIWAEMRDRVLSGEVDWFRGKVNRVVALTERLLELNRLSTFLNNQQAKELQQVIPEIMTRGREALECDLKEGRARRLVKRVQILLTIVGKISSSFDSASLLQFEKVSSEFCNKAYETELPNLRKTSLSGRQPEGVLISNIADVPVEVWEESAESVDQLTSTAANPSLDRREEFESFQRVLREEEEECPPSGGGAARSRTRKDLLRVQTLDCSTGGNSVDVTGASNISIDITKFLLSKSVNNFRNSTRASKRNFSLRVREVAVDLGEVIAIGPRVGGPNPLEEKPESASEDHVRRSLSDVADGKFPRRSLFYRTFHHPLQETSSPKASHQHGSPSTTDPAKHSPDQSSHDCHALQQTSNDGLSQQHSTLTNHTHTDSSEPLPPCSNISTTRRLEDIRTVRQRLLSLKSLFKIDL